MSRATGLVLSVSIVASVTGLIVIFFLAFSPPAEPTQQIAKLDTSKQAPRPRLSRTQRPPSKPEGEGDDVRPTPKPQSLADPQRPEPPYVPPQKPVLPVPKPEPTPVPATEQPEATPGGDSPSEKENFSPDTARYLDSLIAQLTSKNNGKSALAKEASAAKLVLIWHMRRLPSFAPGRRLRLPRQPMQVHQEEPGDTVRALAAVAADDESVTKQIVGWVRAEVAPSARAAACAALPSMRGAASAKGIESLTLALRLDPDPAVRASAAASLGEFGNKVGRRP